MAVEGFDSLSQRIRSFALERSRDHVRTHYGINDLRNAVQGFDRVQSQPNSILIIGYRQDAREMIQVEVGLESIVNSLEAALVDKMVAPLCDRIARAILQRTASLSDEEFSKEMEGAR